MHLPCRQWECPHPADGGIDGSFLMIHYGAILAFWLLSVSMGMASRQSSRQTLTSTRGAATDTAPPTTRSLDRILPSTPPKSHPSLTSLDNPGRILETEHEKEIILKLPRYQEIVPDMLSSVLSESPGKFRMLQEIGDVIRCVL